MRYVLPLIVLFSLTLNAEDKPGGIVVSATFCKDEPLFFSYQDHFTDNIVSLQVKSKGAWKVINSSYPILIFFSKDWKLFPVYAIPGDTINAVCNDHFGIEFYGNRGHSELNILSVIEQKVGFFWPSLMSLRITKRLSFEYLSTSFDSLYKERRRILDSVKNEIPESLNSIFHQFMKYRLAGDYLIPYVSTNRDSEFDLIKDIPSSYLEKWNSVKMSIDDSTMQDDRLYRTYLMSYNEYLAQDSIGNRNTKYMTLYNTAKHFFTGSIKEFLLFKYVKDSLIDKSTFVEDFRFTCKNKVFINYIDSLIELRNNLTKDSKVLSGTLSKPNGSELSFEDLLEIHKGKPIYIDFWASWCGPCIAEIEPLREIEKVFQSRVYFVSISIDEDRSKWLKALKKHSLPPTNQWLTANNSPLAKYLAIQSIPRFILIDKNGKAVSLNAPRPSNVNDLTHLLQLTLR